ncbi:MAG: toprim domain-containing protein [Anaerolinea sp.]|nr:toprim domain-containing protein [Anaerolinea sp.]
MSIDLEQIRSANPIEQLVGEKFTLRKSGTRFIGIEHDSLVVTPATGFYFWNSRGEQGDAFDFAGRHLLGYGDHWNNHDAALFLEVVRYLAERAGISVEQHADLRQSSTWSERQLVRRLHEALITSPAALTYALQTRGWQLSTVKAAQIGFMPPDKPGLLADLNLADKWRSVIGKFPPNLIVYPHFENGRLTYLSGRSIEGKRHYNPPRDLIGERQPYRNHVYRADADLIVLVEGQADAITFAEWNIPALALCGTYIDEALLENLRSFHRVFVALDNTDEARAKSRQIARALEHRAYLPQLPDGVKDANEWLARQHATTDDARVLLNRAQGWLMSEVERAGRLEGLAQEDAIRDLFRHADDLDELALARFKTMMETLGVKGRAFTELLKSARKQSDNGKDNPMPELLDGSVPILSPALGFGHDLALVSVALVERVNGTRLNIQPYVVTSTRELHRLSDAQIIKVGERELALKVIPDGTEFLMRWRYDDIRRFLAGETVAPGDVFATIHRLLTTYIDFGAEIDSLMLALWTIGTYFYSLFPAYPYLALNGPKNSGKSTVLRVLQPLAFNMVTTSDPTGASMFRLIHTTSCTVGIDEAERYHNPKDPALSQIRQLLNSGYKAGMPALRLIGDDFKPQAFNVYSPKILAAIAGLEDILASRCIALPMRRADHKLPTFPADFDGAPIRHQLYTLALTHFPAISRNAFERPELHTLNNRSGELWSPLIALAAFFEEDGRIGGLKAAISTAAERDALWSDGKALSDREEAVLQALELLTRGEDRLTWIKAVGLRRQIADLLGTTVEQIGDALWIGHILKRLHLIAEDGRRRGIDGLVYAVQPAAIRDVMRRYDVEPVAE